MLWGFVIWIILSIILCSFVLIQSANHIKDAEQALAWFCLILGLLIYVGWREYDYQKNGLAYCYNDVTFNVSVWYGNQDAGYKLCNEQYGFWHFLGN